jgi:uncharacterized protein YdeI (BOF family)
MYDTHITKTLGSLTIALAVAATGSAAIAHDEPLPATIAEVNAGIVEGTVSIDGAILGQQAGDEYLFSDGTDVITVDLDDSDSTADEVPTLTLMNIVGSVASGEIDVSTWAPLEIMVPAVIRTPAEAIQSFQGWIIVQNAQVPVSADDMATGPADGDTVSDG